MRLVAAVEMAMGMMQKIVETAIGQACSCNTSVSAYKISKLKVTHWAQSGPLPVFSARLSACSPGTSFGFTIFYSSLDHFFSVMADFCATFPIEYFSIRMWHKLGSHRVKECSLRMPKLM